MAKRPEENSEDLDKEITDESVGIHVPGGVPSGGSGGTAATGGRSRDWKVADTTPTGSPKEQETMPQYTRSTPTNIDSLDEIRQEEMSGEDQTTQSDSPTSSDETVQEYISAEAAERSKNNQDKKSSGTLRDNR